MINQGEMGVTKGEFGLYCTIMIDEKFQPYIVKYAS